MIQKWLLKRKKKKLVIELNKFTKLKLSEVDQFQRLGFGFKCLQIRSKICAIDKVLN